MNKTPMRTILLPLAFCLLLVLNDRTASGQGHEPQQPFVIFQKVGPVLREATKVPLRLPTFFPYVDKEHPIFAKLGSVDSSHYEIYLGWVPECAGQNVCSYGSLYGGTSRFQSPQEAATKDYDGDRAKLTIEPIELSGGIKGQFIDAVCHAYCTESYIRWSEGHLFYAIGMKAEEKQVLIKIANSAIPADVRPTMGQQARHSGDPHGAEGSLGTVEFHVSCATEAQESFTRGVALLHSFTYEESAEAFRVAASNDPRCAMAHWGLAMTEYHQLWEPYAGPAELQRGAAEIQKARELKPGTPREKDYIEALGVFYDGWEQRGHATRANGYREAMRGVNERNPKDQEAAIFYALALLATSTPEDKTYGNQRQAAAILEPVFAAQPNHPGVAHYLIHAYDNPVLAPQGVTAARAYSKIAPDLPHALHMPSHIFTRLGLWQDSVLSNMAAAAAARKHDDQGEEFHALDYLAYAYLQLGKSEEAEKIRDTLPALGSVKPSLLFKINYAKAAIRARCALEQQHWAEAEELVADSGVQPQVAAISHWAAALGAAHTGNLQAARQHAEQVRRLSAELKEKGDEYWAQQVAIQGEEAGAWVAIAEHRTYDALRLLRMAADHEDAAEKHSVTPGAVRPARELLGDLLMEMHQPKQALTAYRQVLTVAPGRRNALKGAEEAERIVGMSSEMMGILGFPEQRSP